VPWCDDCAKFWTPSSMRPDGSCPTCGRHLGKPTDADRLAAAAEAEAGVEHPEGPYTAKNLDLKALAGEPPQAPWHFKLLVVLVAAYLVWRVVQLIIWLVR
jgi:hypothetical protein